MPGVEYAWCFCSPWIALTKQMVLLTAIWLILLNLPSHLQYCPQNIFLTGIIPGPKKPLLSDSNHSIKLLVDVLLDFSNLVCGTLELQDIAKAVEFGQYLSLLSPICQLHGRLVVLQAQQQPTSAHVVA
jgi:hypothetical protein